MRQVAHGSESRRWSNREVVREPDPRRWRAAARAVAALALAFGPLAAYLVVQNEHVEASYELEQLRTEHERLVKEEQQLRIERARLERLTEIETWAVQERGLEQPAAERIVVVRDDEDRRDGLVAETVAARPASGR